MFSRLSRREKVLIWAALTLGLVSLFYRYVLAGQMVRYMELQGRLQSATVKQMHLLRTAKQLDRVQRETEQAETELASLNALLATKIHAGNVLIQIEFRAKESGVALQACLPKPIIDHGTYAELPADLTVSGDYRHILGFINALENLPNLTLIRSFSVLPYSETQMPTSSTGDQSGGANGSGGSSEMSTGEGTVAAAKAAAEKRLLVATFSVSFLSTNSPLQPGESIPPPDVPTGRDDPFLPVVDLSAVTGTPNTE